MAKMKKLSAEDREFFSLVTQAMFANPFSEEREAADSKIAGNKRTVSPSQLIQRSVESLRERMNKFEKKTTASLQEYEGDDQTLLRNALLYFFYYKFIEQCDQFILDQIDAGETSLQVPFSEEAFGWLLKRGFQPEDMKRYFEMVFQLRRAFYFIDRNLIGRSPSMRELQRKLWNSIFTQDLNRYNEYLWNRMEDFSILFLGETGSGKGTAAAAIGRSGFIPFNEKKNCFEESFMRSFTAINLSQFPENLIESELFGHKKGAFTGATEDHQGVFDYSSPYGAIFLDEIGEVSIPIQIKLLNVLQEREFSPVGSHEKRVFKGRVIAATNIPLESLRTKECLRDDFYYRLCSDVIVIPPLRQRIKEDPQAIDELLSSIVSKIIGEPSKDICLMVKKVIDDQLGSHYLWPGNVRELGHCVRRVLINNEYAGDNRIISKGQDEWLIENIRNGGIDAQTLLTGYCHMLYLRFGTYEAVANRTHLDRRTVKKYIDEWRDSKMV